MKKLFTGIILALATCLVFALPSPQQIEQSLAGGNTAYARNAIQEVLIAKPASGKAHLLNAYLLAHYDLNNSAANAELIKATTLEPDLTKTPLFGRVVDELDTHKQIHLAPTPIVATTYIDSNEDSKAAEYVLIGCLGLGIAMLIVFAGFWVGGNSIGPVLPQVKRFRPMSAVAPSRKTGLFTNKKPEHVTPVSSGRGFQG